MSYSDTYLINSSRFYEKAKPVISLVSTFLALFLCFSANASDSAKISPKKIQSQIISFLETELELDNSNHNVEITPHKISKSLNLSTCQQPLTFLKVGRNNNHYGKHTIKVSCSSPRWNFYSGATIKAYGSVLTASTPIAKGEIVTVDHVKLSRVNLAKMNGNALTSSNIIIGLAAKRPIRQGYILTKNQFEPPKLIKRGDGIIIQAVGKSMTVSAPGEALSNGRLGENIRVRNIKSDREVIAKVKNRDTVVVMLY